MGARSRKIDSIFAAAEHGTRLDELKMMRRRIAKALDDKETSPRDLASLSRRQIEISKEIEVLARQQAEDATRDFDTSDGAFDHEGI